MRARALLSAGGAAILLLGSFAPTSASAEADTAPTTEPPPAPETLVVTQSTTLDADHVGNVRIDADGVVLDCAGHGIKGPGAATGFDGGIVFGDRKDITIRRCVVSGFAYNGITGSRSSNVRIEGNTLTENANHGVHLDSVSLTVVSGNAARSNGALGFVITASKNVTIADNVATDQAKWGGFSIAGTTASLVVGNVATRNAGGFIVDDFENGLRSTGNTITRNTANDTGSGFIVLHGSTGNTFSGNTASRNDKDGFSAHSSGNTYVGNTANLNRDGFNLYKANGNVLARNTANGNGQYGFVVFGGSSDNVLVRNTGLRNGKKDAWEEGTGTGDVWARNRFRTTFGL
jgi:parallel beta-helix repeat protein